MMAAFTHTWEYLDAQGQTLGYVGRIDSEGKKEVIPHFKRSEGGFVPGGPPEPRPLFGLEYLAMRNSADPVFIVEGEKTAAALQSLGLIAVTSQGGSKAAGKANWKPLNGVLTVYILPDNDEPGERYWADVCTALEPLQIPPIVKILRLPNLPEKGDAVDWISARVPEWGGYLPVPDSQIAALRSELEGLLGMAELPNAVKVDDWPEPMALDSHKLPEWPGAILPATLESFVNGISRSTETPKELAALTALSVVAAAVQGAYRLHIEGDYCEPLCLWTCVALPSGSRKTAVHTAAIAPLVDWEMRQRKTLEPERKRIESENVTYDDRIAALRKKAASSKAGDFEGLQREINDLGLKRPPVPPIPMLWTSDVTPENLATIMEQNGGAMSIVSDEGGIFDIMAGRYSSGVPNLDVFLKGHAGSPVRVNRSTKPPIDIAEPRLSFALAPQPEVIKGLAGKPGFRGRGLLARFLFALPPSNLGARSHAALPMGPDEMAPYSMLVAELLNRSGTRGDRGPITLQLSPDCLKLLQVFKLRIEPQLMEGGRLYPISDWASKLPGAASRLAALIHLAGGSTQIEVQAEAFKAAESIADFLTEHALVVFDEMGAAPEFDHARMVARWLKREGKAVFRLRDCFNAHKHRFNTMATVEPAVKLLVESAIIRELPRKQPAHRPSREFEVNPQFLRPLPIAAFAPET